MTKRWLLVLSVAFWTHTGFSQPKLKEYSKVRRAIAFIESRGDPAAKNPRTSASGRYQFVKAWNGWFKRNAGITWASVVPKKTAPKPIKERMAEQQDFLFDVYVEEVIEPWIEKTRGVKNSTRLSDGELLALAHRQGTRGAELYLRKGVDPYAGKNGNRHVSSHLKAFRKAMDFENYLESQRLK